MYIVWLAASCHTHGSDDYSHTNSAISLWLVLAKARMINYNTNNGIKRQQASEVQECRPCK
jgi:hypothetical protein